MATLSIVDAFNQEPLLQCSQCSHIQVATMPSSDRIVEYYAAAYGHQRSNHVDAAYHRVMRRRASAQMRYICEHLQAAPGRLLDLGCGFGALLAAASQRDCSVTGVELDPQAIRHARAQGFDVIQAEIDSLPESVIPGHDLITLSHVLEHLRHPRALLRRIREANASIFVEVPHYQVEREAQFRDQEGHLHFFSAKSLDNLLRRQGFNLLHIGEYGPPLAAYYPTRLYSPMRLSLKLARVISRDHFAGLYRQRMPGGMWLRALAQPAR